VSNYTVRVELHYADEEDYETLHDAMATVGFVRWIQNEDGKKYRLPMAEYNLVNTSLDREAVREKAVEASARAKPDPEPWVLVTQSTARCWHGLKLWKES